MTADRCPTCDNPWATDADYAEAERLTDQHGHDHVVQHFSGALCWGRFGQPCEPHDWRAECLRLRVPRDVRPHPDALVLPEEMRGASLAAVWRAAFTAGFDSGLDTGYAQGHTAGIADSTTRIGDLHAMLTAAGIRLGSIGQRIGWALESLEAWQNAADIGIRGRAAIGALRGFVATGRLDDLRKAAERIVGSSDA